jgi:predicted Fe-Mo cluster-binding NifX family protein
MKIALPVENEHKKMFGNAGHTPMFAVYDVNGAGMFRSFAFSELRKNPRTDLDHHHHDHDDEHHTCDHDDGDEEHVRQHHVMAEALEDCDYLVVKRACKNTAKSMANLGVKLVKYNGQGHEADVILRELSAQFV